jgi:hypothetical protein
MIKRALTLVNAMHITASVFINDDAGPWAGCTTAKARTLVVNEWTMPTPQEAGKDICFPLQVMGPDAQRSGPSATDGSMVAPCSPEPLALGSGFFEARQNGWPVSLDGRRRKRVLVKIVGE